MIKNKLKLSRVSSVSFKNQEGTGTKDAVSFWISMVQEKFTSVKAKLHQTE